MTQTEKTLSEFNSNGVTASGEQVDVGLRAHIRAMVDRVIARLERVINNAGITRYTPFCEAAHDAWDPVLDIDLKDVFYCCQAVAPAMVKQVSDKIVNISSSLGPAQRPITRRVRPAGLLPMLQQRQGSFS